MFGRVLSARLVISRVASQRPVPGQLKCKLSVDLPDVDAPMLVLSGYPLRVYRLQEYL